MADDSDFYKEPNRKEWTGFWTLVEVQAQNAFNEKAVQFLLPSALSKEESKSV